MLQKKETLEHRHPMEEFDSDYSLAFKFLFKMKLHKKTSHGYIIK